MSETLTTARGANRYLQLLTAELGDVPADERADMLADLEVALTHESRGL